jgi:hypothetical protein
VLTQPVQHQPLVECAHVSWSSCLRRRLAFHATSVRFDSGQVTNSSIWADCMLGNFLNK